MHRFGQITWQSHARLVALVCWASAIALTGNMGWLAWTSMRETASDSRFSASHVDSALSGHYLISNHTVPVDEKPVAF